MGFNVREAAKLKSTKEQESEEKKKKGFDVRKVSESQKTINFATLSDDLNAMSDTINSIYGGWQDAETMSQTRAEVEKTHKRLIGYEDYRKTYGDEGYTDLSELVSGYQGVLDDWDSLTKAYGEYESADEFNAAVEAQRKKEEAEAKRRQEMLSADVGSLQTEISDLEGKLSKAKGYANAARDVEANQRQGELRSRGLYTADRGKIDAAYKELSDYLESVGYASVDELTKDLTGKKDFAKQASFVQKGVQMASVDNPEAENYDKDFEAKSKYDPSKIKNTGRWSGLYDIYEYINSDEEGKLYILGSANDSASASLGFYDNMDASQISRFNYWLDVSEEKAQEYLDTITLDLESRYAEGRTESTKKIASDHPVISSAYSVGSNVIGAPAEYIKDQAFYNKTGMMSRNVNAQEVATIRGTVSESTDIMLGNWDAFDFVYNTTMSGIDSAVAATLYGKAGGVALGLSAAASATNDALDRGLSNRQAAMQGYMSGAFEMLFETISIGRFLNEDASKGMLENLASSMFVNATEEMATELANIAYDTYANGELSNYALRVQELVDSGMTEEEAKSKVKWELVGQVGEATASGALMGGGFTAINVGNYKVGGYFHNKNLGRAIRANENVGDVFDMASLSPEESSAYEAYTKYADRKKAVTAETARDSQVGNLATKLKADARSVLADENATEEQKERARKVIADIEAYGQVKSISRLGKGEVKKVYGDAESIEALIAEGLESGEGTKAFELATEYKAKVDSGKKLSAAEITRLVDATDAAVKSETEKTASERLTELGETGDVEKLADIIARKETGELLTSAEQKMLEESEFGSRVAEEVTASEEELSEASVGLSEDEATLFRENYSGGDVENYRASFDLVSGLARNNYGADYILENRGVLSPRQVQSIYSKVVAEPRMASQRALDGLVSKYEGRLTYKSKVDDSVFDGVKGEKLWKSLNKRQKQAITFAKAFAKGAGINLTITYGKKYNGYYDPATNSIVIDARAGFSDKYIGEDAIIPTMSHELTHWAKKKAPELYAELSRKIFGIFKDKGLSEGGLIELERKKHPEYTDDQARDEIIARACEDLFSMSESGREIFNSLSENEQKTLTEKIKEIIKNLVDWVNELLGLYESKSEEAGILRGYKDGLAEVAKIWDEMLASAVRVNAALTAEGTTGEAIANEAATEAQMSEKETLTQADVDAVRNISEAKGEISINEFSSDDIVASTSWAKKFYSEIGFKSPFFRAWFGDWRANEKTNVSVIYAGKTEGKNPRGVFKNKDTGWNINSSSVGYDETTSHSGKDKLSLIAMRSIDEIIKNSVLLDTEVSSFGRGKKSIYTAFMHKFYSPVVIDGKPYIAKLAVDESYAPGQNDTNKKFYHVRAIKIEPVSSVGIGFNHTPIMDGTSSDISISDLFQLVKTYDKKFHPKEASKIVNPDGTPKVMYHGSTAQFTVFDKNKAKSGAYGRGFYFTDSDSHAKQYGNLYAVYLDVKNPLKQGEAKVTEGQIRKFLEAVAENEDDYSIENYGTYDISEILKKFESRDAFSVIFDINTTSIGDMVEAVKLWNKINGTSFDGIVAPTETVVFEPTQIKSATDNIGTFDGGNEDIQFSEKVTELTSEDDGKLKSFFGTTGNYEVAGYMLKNGVMLDFSGKHWGDTTSRTRQVDHRDIWEVWSNPDRDGTDEMVNMIANGNIRLMPEVGGINLAVKPSKNQRVVLRRYIEWMSRGEGVIVDIDEVGGDTVKSFTYDKGVSADRVMRDIDNYFKGAVTSDLMQFHTMGDGVQYSRKDYSYESLASKPDMPLTVIGADVPDNRADIVFQAIKNAKSVGYTNENGNAVVHVDDINTDVIVPKKSIVHGLDRRMFAQAPVMVKIGEVLKNAIRINELVPRSDNAKSTYILIGSAVNESNELYIASFVVNRFTNEVAEIDVLYSANAKKESAALLPKITDKSATPTDSIISIAELLEYVNRYFPDILPESVLRHYGHTERPDGTLGESVLFSEKDTGTSAYDIMGEKKALERRYKILEKDFARLKEMYKLDKRLTHGKVLDPKQVAAVARYLVKFADSDYKASELAPILNDLYVDLREMVTDNPDATWDMLYSKAYEVAKEIRTKAKVKVERPAYFEKILKEIRSARIAPNEGQKGDAKHRFGDHYVGKFRGRVTIANDGTPLDIKWAEWAAMYPDVFDKDIGDAQQLVELYDIYDELRNAADVVVEYEESEMLSSLANEIINKAWMVDTFESMADKQEKRMKELRAEHRKAMEELKGTYEQKVDDAVEAERILQEMYYGRMGIEAAKKAKEDKKRAMSKIRETYKQKVDDAHLAERIYAGRALSELRAKHKVDVARAKQAGRERLAAYRENAERKRVVDTITSNSLKLLKMLTDNTKDSHVPESLKGAVKGLLETIDASSQGWLEGGKMTQKDISLNRAFSRLKNVVTSKSQELSVILEEIYGSGIDDTLKEFVDEIDEDGKVFFLNAMSIDELKKLDKVVKILKATVNKVNMYHVALSGLSARQHGLESMRDLEERTRVFDDDKKHFEQIKTKVYWNNLNPYYAFKNLGPSAQGIFAAFQDGQDKLAFLAKEIIDKCNDWYTAKEYKKWSETYFEFSVPQPSGKVAKFSMNVPQIMSLYCVIKQEDARRHILYGYEGEGENKGKGGGITIAETKDKRAVLKNIIVTEDVINEIISKLDGKEVGKAKGGTAKEVADKMQEYMSTRGAELGNEITMARWGIKLFGIENYFPIKVSDIAVPGSKKEAPQDVSASMLSLLNMSFTHARNKMSEKSVEIGDIFDVFSSHMSNMARYNSMALPVLDMYKWLNFKGENEFKEEYSLQEAVTSAFGEHAWGYLQTFLKDVSGATKSGARDNLAVRFFRNSKIAKVAGNIRVVVLQFTSFIRAGAVMDNKYLLRALMHKPKIAKSEENCGIVLWKSLGYYDTDITRGLAEKIKHTEDGISKVIDWSLKGTEWADKITMGALWNACELEIRDTRKDLKVGSKEFNEAIALRLREVIYRTQVVDSLLTRSQMMRSKDGFDKMLTTFGSESTLSFNLVTDVFVSTELEALKVGRKQAVKNNRKYIAKAVMAYVATNIVTTLVQAMFDAFRDYDEDEKDEKYWAMLMLENFAVNSSVLAKIPYANLAVSMLQGFSSSRTEADWMEYIIKWGKEIFKLMSGDGDPIKMVDYMLRAGSDMTGIAAYNVYRDIKALLANLFGEN